MVSVLVLLALAPDSALAQSRSHATRWIATWGAATQSALPGTPMTLRDATRRLIVHATAGESEVRIRLSNVHGSTPLTIGAARIALRLASDTIVPGSDRRLTFGHDSSVVIPPGIIGNRPLRDTPAEQAADFGTALGERGLARFERDVLAQPGVGAVIVRLGVNDLGFPGTFESKARPVTAAELISGYRQLIRRAHARRVRIVGMTMSPFGGAKIHPGFATPGHELVRAAAIPLDALVPPPRARRGGDDFRRRRIRHVDLEIRAHGVDRRDATAH